MHEFCIVYKYKKEYAFIKPKENDSVVEYHIYHEI